MTTAYEINNAGVNAAIDEMMGATKAIENVVNNLEECCATTLGTWVGEAQTVYRSAMTEWDTAVREMQDLLIRASQTLGDVQQTYQAAELMNADQWSGFGLR